MAIRPSRHLQRQALRRQFIDITPDMPDEPRCKEILTWIRNHPEVTRYAVIDDEDDDELVARFN